MFAMPYLKFTNNEDKNIERVGMCIYNYKFCHQDFGCMVVKEQKL